MSATRADELRARFEALPAVTREPVRQLFGAMVDALTAVSVAPAGLIGTGTAHAASGERIRAVVEAQRADRTALAAHWSGGGHAAFDRRLTEIEAALEQLAGAATHADEALRLVAEATVEGTAAIEEIIVGFLTGLLSAAPAGSALAPPTSGASLLTPIPDQIAAGTAALASVLRVVGRVAGILDRVATVLTRLSATVDAASSRLTWAGADPATAPRTE